MMAHVRETTKLLRLIVESHHKVVVWFSGGKDSTTLLHLLRPYAEAIAVVTTIVDGGWPGITEHVLKTCKIWGFDNLTLVSPLLTFAAYRAQFGWPTHLVPTAMDGVMPDPWYDGGPRVASFWHCTALRVLQPLLEVTYALQPDAVLTGSRASDAPAFARIGPTTGLWEIDPHLWTRYNPLHTWTTEEIWRYVDGHKIALPQHYSWKRTATFEAPDCQLCPYSAAYVRHLQAYDPQLYADLMAEFGPTLARWQTVAEEELRQWEDISHG